MDNFEFIKKFEELNTKAHNLDVAMDVIGQKPIKFSELSEMSSDVAEIKELEDEVKQSVKDHKDFLMKDYKRVKELMEIVTDKMFFVLNEIDKEKPKHRVLQELQSPVPKLLDRGDAASAFSEYNTPRMTILEYAKSPLIKKKSRAQLNFSDFQAEITRDDFEKIPSYMRGRTSLSELQEFLDNTVIKCFNGKYELVYKDRKVLKQSEYSLQTMFKDQASYFEGQKFVTIGDLSRIMNKKVDKKDEKFLQCLRHINIIKEVRNHATPCFIWIAK